MSESGDRRVYRSAARGRHSSSDESSGGEEDTPLWRQKQEKYFRKHKGNTEQMCSSPTLPEVKTDQGPPQRKKSNNIWGSVLTEQDLTQTMVRSVAVDQPEEFSFQERNVESYDYRKKYEDRRRSWDEPEEASLNNKSGMFDADITDVKVHSGPTPGRSIIGYEDTLERSRDTKDLSWKLNRQNRKRKADGGEDRDQRSSIHDRLGVKKLTTTRLGDIEMNVDMENVELAAKIADFLHEPKVEIIERIVLHLGKDFAIRLVEGTKAVEESGGMYTVDGSRRRTPGGVYLTMLKQQPEWNKNVRRLIFVEDVEEQAKHRREKRKNAKQQRRRRKANKKNDEAANDKSRSRSNSESRSRSNSNSSSKSTPHKKDNAGEAMEDGEIRRENRSRNNSETYKGRESRVYESSEDSDDDDVDDRQKSNWSKPFNFEDELAAAKKLILEKSESQNKTETGMMESETNESQDKVNDNDMTDLETAEAHVVDIEIG